MSELQLISHEEQMAALREEFAEHWREIAAGPEGLAKTPRQLSEWQHVLWNEFRAERLRLTAKGEAGLWGHL